MPVVLFEIADGAPLVFHCDRLRANLSPGSCATSHRRSFNLACQNCPIGAEHAATMPPTERALTSCHNDDAADNRFERNARRCIRCDRLVLRRVQPGLCISCLNRHAEAVRGRNAKGQFPHRVAATLFLCHALLTGEFPHLMTSLRFKSNCAPRLRRVSGGAFLSGIFGGRAEFDLWLLENHPAAKLEDFELGSSLAETAGYPSALAQRADLSECHVKGVRKVAEDFPSSISEQVLLQSASSLKGAQDLPTLAVITNGY